jgi:CheY-like chemotaxis protein
MVRETLLYVFDEAFRSNALLAALTATGYETASANSAVQAVALLFILHPIAAVVLDRRASGLSSLEVVRSLKAVCPNVPIVLLCRDQIDHAG